jgi:sec-independent protein translocase protein TatA
MFENLGFGEILLIIIVIVVFFGPKRIPDIAQSIGKGIREFKRAMKDVQDEVSTAMSDKPKESPTPQKKLETSAPSQTITSEGKANVEIKP